MRKTEPSPNATTAPDSRPSLRFGGFTARETRIIYPLSTEPVEVLKHFHPAQFSAALAHELRNPLTNINLAVGMLQTALKDDELSVFVDIIGRSAVRMHNLINELLKYKQEEEVFDEDHSIQSLLGEVLLIAMDRIKLKNILVIRDYCEMDFKILLNRVEMKIAFTNIFLNAIDSMSTLGGELFLATKVEGDQYQLHIRDNGCGISAENLQKISTPYFTNKLGGLGLGLATTYEILRNNNVKIDVTSEEGKGTMFVLTFNEKTVQGA
jgi:signal transduction histidine kinase